MQPPNVTYTFVWAFLAHQTLPTQWFGHQCFTKRCVHTCLGTHGKPNATYAMVLGIHDQPNVTYTKVWAPMTNQTLRAHLFGHPWPAKRYVHSGLGDHGSPNDAYTMVWASMAHQTLRTHLFGHTWHTKRYVRNGLGTHCSPNVT